MRLAILVVLSALGAACASAGTAPGREHVDEAMRSRTGKGIRLQSGSAAMPPDVSLDNGLTSEEAVAIALWNSPAFEASLADLGLARADLVDAGLLRNPVLSLLFPVGPKQLEWTLQFPVDVLWQRPRRVKAATLNAEAVAERLVSQGLSLVADVRQAYIDATASERRALLTSDNATLAKRIADIADARLRAGDISDLEARAARSDALQEAAALRALEHDRDLAKVMLASRIGLDLPPEQMRLTPTVAPLTSCAAPDALIKNALASRPDVRAAEIAVEAAGQRASWERSRILGLIATLDANGQGKEGHEMGPGLIADLPVFTRNQGGVSRAAAELERSSRTYLAVRLQVVTDVRAALIRVRQAQQAVQIWETEIVPSLQIEQRQAQTAYEAGEVALLSLLDASRRLVLARTRQLEASISLEKAAVLLEQSIGRGCSS